MYDSYNLRDNVLRGAFSRGIQSAIPTYLQDIMSNILGGNSINIVVEDPADTISMINHLVIPIHQLVNPELKQTQVIIACSRSDVCFDIYHTLKKQLKWEEDSIKINHLITSMETYSSSQIVIGTRKILEGFKYDPESIKLLVTYHTFYMLPTPTTQLISIGRHYPRLDARATVVIPPMEKRNGDMYFINTKSRWNKISTLLTLLKMSYDDNIAREGHYLSYSHTHFIICDDDEDVHRLKNIIHSRLDVMTCVFDMKAIYSVCSKVEDYFKYNVVYLTTYRWLNIIPPMNLIKPDGILIFYDIPNHIKVIKNISKWFDHKGYETPKICFFLAAIRNLGNNKTYKPTSDTKKLITLEKSGIELVEVLLEDQ